MDAPRSRAEEFAAVSRDARAEAEHLARSIGDRECVLVGLAARVVDVLGRLPSARLWLHAGGRCLLAVAARDPLATRLEALGRPAGAAMVRRGPDRPRAPGAQLLVVAVDGAVACAWLPEAVG